MAFRTPEYPGIKLDDNYGPDLNAVAISFMTISAVAIILRIISRVVTKLSIQSDDWLIFVSAILSWAYSATIIVEADQNFYGQHIGKSDPEHLEEFLKGLYALAIVYPIALTTSKLSYLVLLWRIFHVGAGKVPIIVAASLNIAWMIAAVLVGIFSCSPVQGFWDLSINSSCIQEYNFFLANECLTIVLDLVVLFTPIYFVSQINRSLSQRIAACITFGLGLVVTIVSSIRLWQLVEAQKRPGNDPTFNEIGAALWAIVELNVWIVVATIPSLRLLVHKVADRWRGREEMSYPSSGKASSMDNKRLGQSRGSSTERGQSSQPVDELNSPPNWDQRRTVYIGSGLHNTFWSTRQPSRESSAPLTDNASINLDHVESRHHNMQFV